MSPPPCGEGRGGGGQRLSYDDGHAFQVLHHVDRLKTKSAEAFTAEHCITNAIVLCLAFRSVLASVHFYDQAMRIADEIQEIATHWGRPAKVMAFLSQCSKEMP